MVEFHQVLPGRSPRAGAGEGTITRALEPFGMVLLEARAPASMVDHDIEKHPRASEMRCVRQLAELIDAGGAPVELDQCGVDAGQVQTRIGAAEAAEPCISCGHRIHRQQMQNAATKRTDNVRQLPDQAAEVSRGWNHRITECVELFELRFQLFILRSRNRPRFAKHPGERAINGIARAVIAWVNGNPRVRPVRPMLPAIRIDQIGLGAEKAGFGQRQFQRPAGGRGVHGQVMPRHARERQLSGMGLNDFFT